MVKQAASIEEETNQILLDATIAGNTNGDKKGDDKDNGKSVAKIPVKGKKDDNGKDKEGSEDIPVNVVERKPVAYGASYGETAGYILDEEGDYRGISKSLIEDLEDGGVEPHGYVTVRGKRLPFWIPNKYSYTQSYSTQGGYSNVNTCVFDGIDDARKSLGMGSFDIADKNYFKNHPSVDSGGVQRSGVLGVAHALLKPWGLGIKDVYLPRGAPINPEHAEFRSALGVNPKALANSSTTDAEFVEELIEGGVPKETAIGFVKDIHWHYVDEPPRPCVIMYTHGNSGTAAVAAGATGGHAMFIGPRAKSKDGWLIAITIGRIGIDVTYDIEPLEKYVKVEERKAKTTTTKSINAWQCEFEGKTPYQHRNSKWNRNKSKSTGATSAGGTAKKKKQGGTSRWRQGTRKYGQHSKQNGLLGNNGPLDTDWIQPGNSLYIIADGCPVCGSDLAISAAAGEETCITCDYNSEVYVESSRTSCKKHGVRLVFDGGRSSYDPSSGIYRGYFCPSCLMEKGIYDIASYLEETGLTDDKVIYDGEKG